MTGEIRHLIIQLLRLFENTKVYLVHPDECPQSRTCVNLFLQNRGMIPKHLIDEVPLTPF